MSASKFRFLTQHIKNDITILTFTESLLNADAVHEAISVIKAGENRKVILDCRAIRSLVSGSLFPDQAPFTPLLKFTTQWTEEGGRMLLCNVAPDLGEVLRITRMDRIYGIRLDVENAVACLKE